MLHCNLFNSFRADFVVHKFQANIYFESTYLLEAQNTCITSETETVRRLMMPGQYLRANTLQVPDEISRFCCYLHRGSTFLGDFVAAFLIKHKSCVTF